MPIEPIDPFNEDHQFDDLPQMDSGEIDHRKIRRRAETLAGLHAALEVSVHALNVYLEAHADAPRAFAKGMMISDAMVEVAARRKALPAPDPEITAGPIAVIVEHPRNEGHHMLMVHGVFTKLAIDANSYARLETLAERLNQSWAEGKRRGGD